LYDIREKELEDCRQQIRTYYNQIIEMYKEANDSRKSLNTNNGKINNSLANSQ